MAVSKRLRYEVLRRDNHACRYCGRAAPEVKLTIDHVVPTTLGGTDDPANLVTACIDCNAGKSATTPDAPLVADISADAIRWSRAMQAAADVQLAEFQERNDLRNDFAEHWNQWTYGSKFDRKTLPLPGGWGKSVDTFLASGLPMDILYECIDLAMGAKSVQPEETFRYMCGIAWKKVGELREVAAGMIQATEPQGPRPCGHIQPPGPCTICAGLVQAGLLLPGQLPRPTKRGG